MQDVARLVTLLPFYMILNSIPPTLLHVGNAITVLMMMIMMMTTMIMMTTMTSTCMMTMMITHHKYCSVGTNETDQT